MEQVFVREAGSWQRGEVYKDSCDEAHGKRRKDGNNVFPLLLEQRSHVIRDVNGSLISDVLGKFRHAGCGVSRLR